jgi:O-antigen/teichoic acid export membrane protein
MPQAAAAEDPVVGAGARLDGRPMLLNAVAGMLPLAVGLLLVPVQLAGLGPQAFGAWSLVAASVGMVSVLDLGLATSLFRFFGVNGERNRAASDRLLSTALLAVLGLLVVASPVLYLAAPAIGSLLHQDAGQVPATVATLRWLGPVVVLPLLVAALAARLQSAGRFGLLAVSVVVGQVVYAGAVLVARHGQLTGAGLARAMVAGQAVTAVCATVAVLAGVGWRPWRAGLLARDERREVAGFARRMQVAGVWGFVNLEADTLIVAAFLPVSSIGAYAIGASVSGGLRSALSTLLPPLLTPLSDAGTDVPVAADAMATVQRRWVRLAAGPALLCVPLAAGVALVLGHSLGHSLGLASGAVAAALMAGNAVNLGTAVLSYLTRVLGRPDLEARYGRFSALVNIGVTLALTPWFGLVGVCVGTGAGQVVGSLWFIRLVRRSAGLPLPSFVRDVPLAAAAIATAVMGGTAVAVQLTKPPTLVALVALGVGALLAWATYRWVGLPVSPPSRRAPARRPRSPQPS